MVEKIEAEPERISEYPFDQSEFAWRFEMSHFAKDFNGKPIQYRFDFYEQVDSSIEIYEDFDNCPELELLFSEIRLLPLREKKSYKNK